MSSINAGFEHANLLRRSHVRFASEHEALFCAGSDIKQFMESPMFLSGEKCIAVNANCKIDGNTHEITGTLTSLDTNLLFLFQIVSN